MRQGKFAELAERVEDQCTVWGIDDFLRSSAALLKLLALLLYARQYFIAEEEDVSRLDALLFTASYM